MNPSNAEWQKFSARHPLALSGSSKPRRSRPTQREPARQAAETDRVARVVERSRDVADADDADQAIVLEHRQMAECGSCSGDDRTCRAYRSRRRKPVAAEINCDILQIDAGSAVFGNSANDVAFA